MWKSDSEPAILALKKEAKVQAKDVEIVLQEAPARDHSANGAVEAAVRDQKRQIRIEVEENLGELDDTHPILIWLSRHAAFCLSRFSIKDDGRIPYQKLTGRKWNRRLVPANRGFKLQSRVRIFQAILHALSLTRSMPQCPCSKAGNA